MSDQMSQAKQARETLARALGALQSDPSIPPQLMNVAEPVSQAMGALFQIERTGSLATAGAARDHVRAALGLLQQAGGQHPAVTMAMESVAGSLGLVFSLVKAAEAAPAPQAAPAQAYPAPAPQQAAFPQQPPVYQQPAPQQPAFQPAAAPQQPQARAPQAAAPAPAPAAPPVQVPTGTSRFEASLGTNSATNFYKGLSGNDVVEHGGIFVATYAKTPKVGSAVAIRVTMPGGYDFEALGVVAWTRDQRGGEGEMQPGFGARFTQIATEHKQLIYRYVRNREPLFHDDF